MELYEIFLVLCEGLSSFVEIYEARKETESLSTDNQHAHSKVSARQRLSLKELLDRDNARLQAGFAYSSQRHTASLYQL